MARFWSSAPSCLSWLGRHLFRNACQICPGACTYRLWSVVRDPWSVVCGLGPYAFARTWLLLVDLSRYGREREVLQVDHDLLIHYSYD